MNDDKLYAIFTLITWILGAFLIIHSVGWGTFIGIYILIDIAVSTRKPNEK